MTQLRSQLHDDGGRLLVVGGVHWMVYELPSPYDRRETQSLVFESVEVVRRVRAFPENWRELSDADLWALSVTP